MTKDQLIIELKEYKVKAAKLNIMHLKLNSYTIEQQLKVSSTLNKLQYEVDIIKYSLDALQEVEQLFIGYKYHNNYTIDDIADKMCIGTATVSRLNKTVLEKLLSIINIEGVIEAC